MLALTVRFPLNQQEGTWTLDTSRAGLQPLKNNPFTLIRLQLAIPSGFTQLYPKWRTSASDATL